MMAMMITIMVRMFRMVRMVRMVRMFRVIRVMIVFVGNRKAGKEEQGRKCYNDDSGEKHWWDWRKLGTVLRLKSILWGVEWASFIRKSEVCIRRVHHSSSRHQKFGLIRCMGGEPQALSAPRSTLHSAHRHPLLVGLAPLPKKEQIQ